MKDINTALEEKDPAVNLPEQTNENENLMKTDALIAPAPLFLSPSPAAAASASTDPSQFIYTIKPTEDIQIHELAAAFPLPEGKEYKQLKRSIEAEGQQIPVIMYKGKLLDGRNRRQACRELGIPIKAVEWSGTGNLEDLIISLNLHRRHMTASQRAALAVKLLPALEQQAAERRGARNDIREKIPLCGKAVDLAGAKVGVSGKYVIKAEKIFNTSMEIYMKLLNGKLTISQAEKVLDPQLQSQSPREALLEALRQVIKLVPDDLKGRLSEIAKECPTLEKALESSAESESRDGEGEAK